MIIFPDWLGIADVTIKTKTITQVAEARSFRRVTRKVGGQRWELTLKSIQISDNLIRKAFAFQARLEGRHKPFSIVLPKYSYTQGVQTASPFVKTTTKAGLARIPTRALKKSAQGCLVEGDFIRFAGHSKIYQVAGNVDASASGQGTVSIYPALIHDVLAGERIIVNNVDFTLALNNDVQQFNYLGSQQRSHFEFDCVEVFQ